MTNLTAINKKQKSKIKKQKAKSKNQKAKNKKQKANIKQKHRIKNKISGLNLI